MNIHQKINSLYTKFEKYLPSKKFLAVLSGGIAVAIFVFAVGLIDFKKIGSTLFSGKEAGPTVGELIDLDSDQDGIKDWEERLWGTDPYKRDTDEDGTPDGVEIEERRKKLKQESGTEDGLFVSTNTNELVNTNQNETDKFAREFFTTIISLQQSGNLNDQTLNALLSSFEFNTELLERQKIFRAEDIVIIEDSLANNQNYINQMEIIFSNNSLAGDNSLEIISIALEEENYEVLDELILIKQNYQNFINGFISIPVPNSAVEIHLGMLNAFQGVVESLDKMNFVLDDPILGISSINGYFQNLENIMNTLTLFVGSIEYQ